MLGHAIRGAWWMLFCESDGRVLGHALDGRLQDWRPGARGMQSGVLVDAVLRA